MSNVLENTLTFKIAALEKSSLFFFLTISMVANNVCNFYEIILNVIENNVHVVYLKRPH